MAKSNLDLTRTRVVKRGVYVKLKTGVVVLVTRVRNGYFICHDINGMRTVECSAVTVLSQKTTALDFCLRGG